MVTTRRSIGVGSSTARATKRRYSVWNGASDPADSDGRRPRPPRLTWPPFRPAERASSGVHSWAVPFACAARPPLLAISFWRSGLIDAKPRRSLRSVEFTFVASSSRSLQMRVASCFRAAARMTQESHAPHSGMPAAHELSATHRIAPPQPEAFVVPRRFMRLRLIARIFAAARAPAHSIYAFLAEVASESYTGGKKGKTGCSAQGRGRASSKNVGVPGLRLGERTTGLEAVTPRAVPDVELVAHDRKEHRVRAIQQLPALHCLEA